jgi:5,10-methenyltetrahydrofolate synthetase
VEWLLANGVRPTIFYYNPNIWPREEYEIRKNESKRHAEGLGIRWIDGDYDHEGWRCGVQGLEGEPERGSRCEQCFMLRLTAAAQKAKELGIRWFSTTLASSRWKSLEQIERAGMRAQEAVDGTVFWAQNWRKGGLQERRNQLLKEYGFYNQQYCGCEFSACGAGALTKPLLREQMKKAKKQHQEQLAMMSADIVERLYSSLITHHSSLTLMSYWPLKDEVDIRPLTDRLVSEGHTVVLPKVIDGERMELRRYSSSTDLVEGAFHIMEPVGEPFTDYAVIDVALVPGVAFDAAGRRLGRGRGYYDRFLAACPQIYKIGVCFPFQRVAEVPSEAHDVTMDEVI